MRGTGITVDAPMFTTSVWVYAVCERDIGAIVLGEDRPRSVPVEFGFDRGLFLAGRKLEF
jgi:hypothetical protein